MLKSVCLYFLSILRYFLGFKKEKAHLLFSIFLDPRYYGIKEFQAFQESCGKDQSFTSEFKSHYIGYFYQLILDLKQCNLVDPHYLNTQISDPSDSEEDLQSPWNLLKSEHKVYCSMEKNKQDEKVKHPSHFCAKYR